MSVQEKLEIGCAIFFGMLCNKEMKQIMRSNLGQQSKIEETSIKYLDMVIASIFNFHLIFISTLHTNTHRWDG